MALQRRDLLADGRLRHAPLARDRREAPRLYDALEGAHRIQPIHKRPRPTGDDGSVAASRWTGTLDLGPVFDHRRQVSGGPGGNHRGGVIRIRTTGQQVVGIIE